MREVLSSAAAPVFGALVGARNRLYDRGWLPVESAPRPVISVGNVTVGGAGKTPLVLYLADRLLTAGTPVAVLTRGYGRVSRRPIVLPPGAPLPPLLGPDAIGDEPWFLRRRLPALGLGIGPHRRRAAQALAPHLPGGVFLLDDGFQHRKLRRDLDLVVVAAGEPLANGALLPFGRLREPPSSLSRAHRIIVVAPPGKAAQGNETTDADVRGTLAEVARFAPDRPVATARMCLRGFRRLAPAGPQAGLGGSSQTGLPLLAPSAIGGPVATLAGIARPERLATGLAAAGLTVAAQHEFPDHYRFSPRDLEAIAGATRGLSALVTTEKDEPRLLSAGGRPSSGPLLDGVPTLVAVLDLVFTSGEAELLRAVGAVAGVDLVTRR